MRRLPTGKIGLYVLLLVGGLLASAGCQKAASTKPLAAEPGKPTATPPPMTPLNTQ